MPYPKDEMTFKRLVVLGWQLRKLHLLESPKLTTPITTYPESGSDMVEPKYPKFEVAKETHDTESLSIGRVYINAKQYFGNVPEVAWQFYIGGYQPAQKWLKDRQGRTLTSEDLVHYQKIIVALAETNRIMGEIDVVV